MGCCGGGVRLKTIVPDRPPASVLHRNIQNTQPKTLAYHGNSPKAGSVCRYCGERLTEKAKKTLNGWIRVVWCSKCRVES